MIAAELSRRVAKARQSEVFLRDLTFDDYLAAMDALAASDAQTFDELPVNIQELITQAEDSALTAAGDFDEAVHPRDNKGKFAKKPGGGASKSLKITHMLVHKNHGEPGTVLTESGSGDKRVVWDGKEYRLQRKKDDGSWTTDKKVKKSKAYVEINAYDSDWREPAAATENDTNGAPSSSSKPSAGNAPASPKVEPKSDLSLLDMGDLTKVKPYKNGGIFKSSSGDEWFVKPVQSESHMHNQQLASNLYLFADVKAETPLFVKLDHDKLKTHLNTDIASQTSYEPGEHNVIEAIKTNAKTRQQVYENFAIDAWLGNWDVVGLGYENLTVDKDGNVKRNNLGGSLLYRANGEPKGNAFGDTVTEIDSLRNPHKNPSAAKIFADVTDDDIRAGVAKIEALSPSTIDFIVDQSGVTGDDAALLKKRLKARRQDLIDKYGSNAPKPSVPNVPATSSQPTATNALGGTKTYTASQKAKVQSIFAKHQLHWYNKTNAIYDAAHEVSTTHPDLTMGDALDIMDQSLKKKEGNPFRTKVEKWLKTNAGKQHAIAKGGSASLGGTAPKVSPAPLTPPAKLSAPSKTNENGFSQLNKPEASAIQAKMDKETPPPWTTEQRDALRTYTGGSYTTINKCARGTSPCDPSTKATLEHIKAAMKPSTRDILLYRATNPASFGIASGDELESMVGKTISDDGVISTSITKIGWSGEMKLEIEVPKGSNMAWVQPISLHPSENEMVLAPGTHYEVVSYQKESGYYGDTYTVKLRVVPGSDTLSREQAKKELVTA